MNKSVRGENLLGVTTIEDPVSFNKISNALTGIRDVDLKILSDLDDRSLLSFCILGNKNGNINNLCNDAGFWRNRFIKTYEPSREWVQKQNMTVWKKIYLKLTYYLSRAKEEGKTLNTINSEMDWALSFASKDGNIDVINFLISKGVSNWVLGLKGAVESNNQSLINFYNNKTKFSVNDYDELLQYAVKANDKQLVDYYIEKGADPLRALSIANNPDMSQYLYSKSGIRSVRDFQSLDPETRMILENYLNDSDSD